MTNTTQLLNFLGGLSPQQFMKRHWQKKPLLVRAALPGVVPLLSRAELFGLAARDNVESRLVKREQGKWLLRHGPFARRALPPLTRPGWTLLVQGVDLQHDAAHQLLAQFRFVPQARLDDLMISYASDGGGVGPHFDNYDVFLLQVEGRRRWRIGHQKNLTLREDVPLKLLAHFEPEHEWLLEPGDMLYLPPRYAHDGIAVGQCQTYSIGFRAPTQGELASQLLQRLAEAVNVSAGRVYSDPKQAATDKPAMLMRQLQMFAHTAFHSALKNPRMLNRLLGEYLTEPKANVWFETGDQLPGIEGGLVLDRRSRMLYDTQHVFINGESIRIHGKDAALLRALANRGSLSGADLLNISAAAKSLLESWQQAGWVRAKHRGSDGNA